MLRRSILATLFVLAATLAFAQSPAPSFEHVPLHYHGPDPTSNYFLPASTPFEREPSTFAQLPAPSEVAPELLHYPNSGFEALPSGPGMAVDPTLQFAPQLYGGEPLYLKQPISDHKDGFFQKAGLTETYLARRSVGGFGVNEVDLFATVAVPAPTRRWPMLITTAFNVRFLDGPVTPALPARLYETYVDFLWVPRLSNRWTAIIGVAPSLYTDGNVDYDDAFRLTGKGLIRYDVVPERVQVIAGVLYLNREDVRLLPAGGVIWIPSDSRKYEMIFPRPKLAHRIRCGPGWEDWVYLGGEFGGNTFVYEQAGTVDKVTLRDYRALLGLERKKNGGAGYRIEVGYAFSRTAEFASGMPDVNADDTALVRGGMTF